MTRYTILSDDDLQRELKLIPEWRYEGGKIAVNYIFGNFRDAVSFIVQVSFAADKLDHHPDITNTYNKVGFALNTHDAGGKITDLDIALATQISATAFKFSHKGKA